MGCGSSKAAGLISVKPQGPGDTSNKAPVLTNSEVPAEVKRSASQASLRSTKTGRSMLSLKARKERENQEREPESSDSLSSLDIRSSGQEVKSERASAKSSRTVDSGIGEEYAHIITEHSDQERKQAVENEKRLPMPGLPLLCTRCYGSTCNITGVCIQIYTTGQVLLAQTCDMRCLSTIPILKT